MKKSKNLFNGLRLVILNFLTFFSICSCYADNVIHENFYSEGLDNFYTITDKGLIVTRIIEFPGISSEELYKKVLNYFAFREEHMTKEDDSTSYGLSRVSPQFLNRPNSLAIRESSTAVKKLGTDAHYCNYLYRVEVKNEKIRVTFFLNFFVYDLREYYALEVFPYTKEQSKPAIKCLKQWKIYFNEILDSLKADLLSDNELVELKSDW